MLFLLLSRYSTYDANRNYKPVDQMNPEGIKSVITAIVHGLQKKSNTDDQHK